MLAFILLPDKCLSSLERKSGVLCVLCSAGQADDRDQAKLEEKLWDPECPLTNKQIDQFLVVAR